MFFSKLIVLIFDFLKPIQTENAARDYGLEDAELFQTIDLFEKRNIPQVTQCLFALGRQVSSRLSCDYHLIFSF